MEIYKNSQNFRHNQKGKNFRKKFPLMALFLGLMGINLLLQKK